MSEVVVLTYQVPYSEYFKITDDGSISFVTLDGSIYDMDRKTHARFVRLSKSVCTTLEYLNDIAVRSFIYRGKIDKEYKWVTSERTFDRVIKEINYMIDV